MTYSEFFNHLPNNATVVLHIGEGEICEYTPAGFLEQFKEFTNLDPDRTEMECCAFTIKFNDFTTAL